MHTWQAGTTVFCLYPIASPFPLLFSQQIKVTCKFLGPSSVIHVHSWCELAGLLNRFPNRSYVWVNSGGLPPTLMEVNRPATWSNGVNFQLGSSGDRLSKGCDIGGAILELKIRLLCVLKSIYSQRKGAQMYRSDGLRLKVLATFFRESRKNNGFHWAGGSRALD